MAAPSTWDLLRCFGRTYFVNAAYNPRGLQNIGQIFAVEPVLAVIYEDGEALREARARHIAHANCHPFFVPAWIGMVLVHPDFRRQGIGSALIARLLDVARARDIDLI